MKAKEFLMFNGKKILFQNINGIFWVAIKPICDALGIEFTRQFKNVNNDEILSQLLAKQPMVGADNRTRNMVSLPEEFIYGWIFSIKSNATGLKDYKMQCYRVMFAYFHGSVTYRQEIIKKQCEVEIALADAEKLLHENADYQNFLEIKKREAVIKKELRSNDKLAKEEIFNLFNLPEN